MPRAAILLVLIGVPFSSHAAYNPPAPLYIYGVSWVSLPHMTVWPYSYQTVSRAGDSPRLELDVAHPGLGNTPEVTVDFSPIGLPASTTQRASINWSALYTDTSSYDFGYIHISSTTPNGTYYLPVTASDTPYFATSTVKLIVDSIPPTLDITSTTFSSNNPKAGDTLTLSGVADGTGSHAKIYDVSVRPLNADGSPLWGSPYGTPLTYYLSGFQGVLDQVNNNIASSTRRKVIIPVPLVDTSPTLSKHPIADAAALQITVYLIDEANLTKITTVTVPVPHGPQISNVLFLPGIEGSRLYEGTGCGKTAEEKLWEPASSLADAYTADAHVNELGLDASGKSICSDIYTKPNDIVHSVYQSFETEMNNLVASSTINAWEPIAYDWRLSLNDILNNGTERNGKIYYEEATSTPYIEQELRHLAATSQTGKVTIVAHSNGGLVAKALMEKLGNAETAKLIDKVILVAVPQNGTPAAIGSLLLGYDAGIHRFGIPIVDNITARTFVQNSPMAYHLLPSEDYLESTLSDPFHRVVSFEGSAYAKEIAAYGTSIANQASLDNFLLAKDGGRTQAADTDLWSAKIVNPMLIDYTNTQHAALDTWTPPAGVSVDEVAGWGVDTVAGIDFYTASWIDILGTTPHRAYRPVFTEDGDGTVTVPSALQTASSTNVKRYWVNLVTLDNDQSTNYTHANLLDALPVQNLITNLLERNTTTLPMYIQTSPFQSTSNKKLTYFLHSPLTLQITDASGNVTGLSTDGSVNENIPGSRYGQFGEVKYVTVPEGNSYQLTMHGLASGTFSFDMEERSGNIVTASSTIAGVPTTASTTVTMAIPTDASTLLPMNIDENGDGKVDTTITPKFGQTIVFDNVPPELQVTFSTTTKAITWKATDNSGFAAITSTTSPQRSTLEEDLGKKGKSADGGKHNKKEISQRDDSYAGPFVTTVTARDAAGNTTTLSYRQATTPPSRSARNAITLQTISYNGATTTLANAQVSYNAAFNERKNLLESFTANLRTASTTVTAIYQQRRHETIITTRPTNESKSDKLSRSDKDHIGQSVRKTLPGLVIPYMKTEKRSLIISY